MSITTFENKKVASYIQKGEGVPLVFIHGFCQDSSVWEDLVQRFPGRYLIRIDLFGFGESELIDNYSITRYADVVFYVIQKLNITKFIFIGHSMGGYVGLEFAKKYKNLLQGFCLFHSHPYNDDSDKKDNRKKSIDFINTNGPIYYVKQLIPALFASIYRTSNHLELAKLVFKASKYPTENIIASLEMMMKRNDNTDVLKYITCPVLFIIGKEDTVVPDYLKETALPNISNIQLLDKVGHMGMLEATKKCEKIIKDFIILTEL